MDAHHLEHHLLIAMPQLQDPGFEQTVTYMVQHSDEGAMGFTLNRPLTMSLTQLLEHLDIPVRQALDLRAHAVVAGGPVDTEAGFVLHPPGERMWKSTLPLHPELWLTTSRDILEDLARGAGPERSLIALGHAGWGPGQLEQEIADNAWLVVPADTRLLFDVPFEERWHASARLLGVDLALLARQPGRA